MHLRDFKQKAVPGLYLFDHFEHPCGAFIQKHLSGTFFIYRNSSGGMSQEIRSVEELRKVVEADEPAELEIL